jgi:hypothetical protein
MMVNVLLLRFKGAFIDAKSNKMFIARQILLTIVDKK